MIHFRQHIPAFVDVDDRQEFDVPDTAALLAHPQIAAWKAVPWEAGLPFDGFFQSRVFPDAPQHLMLMGTWGGQSRWWVIGYLSGDPVDLPVFNAGEALLAREAKEP